MGDGRRSAKGNGSTTQGRPTIITTRHGRDAYAASEEAKKPISGGHTGAPHEHVGAGGEQ